MDINQDIYLKSIRGISDLWAAGLNFTIEKELNDVNEVILYFESEDFLLIGPIVISNFTKPLPINLYQKYENCIEPLWESIIWGIQYAIDSYTKVTDLKYCFTIKIVSLHSCMISLQQMFSYMVIEGVFTYLHFNPDFPLKRILNLSHENSEEIFTVYFPEANYQLPIGAVNKSIVWGIIKLDWKETDLEYYYSEQRRFFDTYCTIESYKRLIN